jgi:hypothetical protein
MLARYFPGKGICYVDSVNSVKQKLKNADIFIRKNRAVCVVKCFNNPVLTGNSPLSVPSNLVNGGAPSIGGSCYIDGGQVRSNCFNNPTLTGDSPSSNPTYIVNGGMPSSTLSCYIDGSHL